MVPNTGVTGFARLPLEIEFSILDQLHWTQYHTASQVCKLWRKYLKHKAKPACYHRWPQFFPKTPKRHDSLISQFRRMDISQPYHSARDNPPSFIFIHELIYRGGITFCVQTTPTGEDAGFGRPRDIYLPSYLADSMKDDGDRSREWRLYLSGMTFDGTYRRIDNLSYLNHPVFPVPISNIAIDCFRYRYPEDKTLDYFIGHLRFMLNKSVPLVLRGAYTVRDLLELIRRSALEEVKGFWRDPASLVLVLKKPVLVETGTVYLSIGVAPTPVWKSIKERDGMYDWRK
ncbi:hypothetical protein TWF281_009772 [Arthrobotrys megalospora]